MPDLTTTIAATLAAAIAGKTPGSTTQDIWTAHDTTGATWNASNVFLNAISNKSSLGFWRNPATAGGSHCIAIGPHTIMVAAHTGPFAGTTGYLYKEDGTVVTWTPKNIDQIPGTDICIITTNETLTGIVVAPLMPSNYTAYLHLDSTEIFGIYATQDEKLFVCTENGYHIGQNHLQYLIIIAPAAADVAFSWYQLPRTGDSGSPYGWIVGGKFVAAMTYGGGGGQTNFAWYYASQIQAIMTARGTDTITYADLSSFTRTSDPVVDIPVVTPLPPAPLSSLSTIAKRVGAGGDYASLSLFNTDIDANYTQQANYLVSLIGGALLAGTTINDGDIVGGASNSSLTFIGDTANAVAVGALLQSDIAGQAVVRGVWTSTASVAPFTITGLQFGSSTSSGVVSLGSNAAVSPMALCNSFVRVIVSSSNPITLSGTFAGQCTLQNVDILANNSVSATQVMVNISHSAGTASTYILRHVSNHVSGAPLAFTKVALTANSVVTLDNTNVIATSTNSGYNYFGTISLASGAATLKLTGSGIRCGVWNATNVKAAGVTIIDATTDIVQGVVSSTVFANTTLGLKLLANATTLVTAVTSPVATDINGGNRPTTNGTRSSVVWAGMVNMSMSSFGTLTETRSLASADTTLTFAVASASSLMLLTDGYADPLTGTRTSAGTLTDPATSPVTVTNGRANAHVFTVQAVNSDGLIFAQSVLYPPVPARLTTAPMPMI